MQTSVQTWNVEVWLIGYSQIQNQHLKITNDASTDFCLISRYNFKIKEKVIHGCDFDRLINWAEKTKKQQNAS